MVPSGVSAASGEVTWGARRIGSGTKFLGLLLHMLWCARHPTLGPWAAHGVRTLAAILSATRGLWSPEDPPRQRSAADERVEVLAWEADREAGPPPPQPAGAPQDASRFDPDHDLANLIANAESEGIAVVWSDLDVRIGGFVMRPRRRRAKRRDPRSVPVGIDPGALPRVAIGDLVVVLNPAQGWIATYETMLHELAHALLGHVGGPPSVRQSDGLFVERRHTPRDVAEFEAHAAAYVAAQRRGGRARRIGLELMLYWARLEPSNERRHVDLVEVFRAAETLAAWCSVAPPAVTVPAGGPARVDPTRSGSAAVLDRPSASVAEDRRAREPVRS